MFFTERGLEILYLDKTGSKKVAESEIGILQTAQKEAKKIIQFGFYLQDQSLIIPPSRIVEIKVTE